MHTTKVSRLCAAAFIALICALPASAVVIKQSQFSNGFYIINTAGTYQISGTLKGTIIINSGAANTILEGVAGTTPKLVGTQAVSGGNESTVGHVQCYADGCTIRNFRIENFDGQSIRCLGGTAKISNMDCETTNLVNGERAPSTGGIVVGAGTSAKNSTINNCKLKVGDDAIKITEAYSTSTGCTVNHDFNGATVQLGWAAKFDGAKHHATSVKVSGVLKGNPNNQNGYDSTPGRSVVGGEAKGNNGSDIKIRITSVEPPANYAYVVNLDAESGSQMSGIDIDVQFPANSTLVTQNGFSSIDLSADGNANSKLSGAITTNAKLGSGVHKLGGNKIAVSVTQI